MHVNQLGSWEELPVEIVRDHPDALPALVLRATTAQPLTLHLTTSVGPGLPATVVGAILVQARIGAEGTQVYRTRFLLTRLGVRSLDLALPSPLRRTAVQALLDNRPVPVQFL